MRKTLLVTGAVLLTAGIAAAALAGPRGACPGAGFAPGARGAMLLESFDTDGDDRVTRAEIRAVRADRFARFDSDGDGTLDLAEFEPLAAEARRPMTVDRFQALDADGDGVVTAAEFDRPLQRMLAWGDADGDGAIGPEDRRQRLDGRRANGWRN